MADCCLRQQRVLFCMRPVFVMAPRISIGEGVYQPDDDDKVGVAVAVVMVAVIIPPPNAKFPKYKTPSP